MAMHSVLSCLVEGVDQLSVAFSDDLPPDLARARQLTVVGIKFLEQEGESADRCQPFRANG
jgi:hypothetical protein